VLRAIAEEPEGAVAKVQEHAYTIALLVVACPIVVLLAVAPEGSKASIHEPAIGAVSIKVAFCGIKVRPADTNEDVYTNTYNISK
jgi:hypothetical protein